MMTRKAILLPEGWADTNPSMWHWILQYGPELAEVVELTEETAATTEDCQCHAGKTRWVSEWEDA